MKNQPYVKKFDENGICTNPITTGYFHYNKTTAEVKGRKVSSTKVGAGNYIQLLTVPNKYGAKSIRHLNNHPDRPQLFDLNSKES
jgi:hypothetical protein